jgi:uncharacterized protein
MSPSPLPQPSLTTGTDSDTDRATTLISTLNLTYLPKESGYIGLLGRSSQNVSLTPAKPGTPPRLLAAQSHNYYLLTTQHPTNYLHYLESDDTHVLVEGGPVEYFIFHPPPRSAPSAPSPSTSPSAPRVEKLTLGRDFSRGQTPVIAIPGGTWKALRLCKGAAYALMVNVLSPEFTADERVRIGEGRAWVEMFQGRAEWASREYLTELVGANWAGDGPEREVEEQ